MAACSATFSHVSFDQVSGSAPFSVVTPASRSSRAAYSRTGHAWSLIMAVGMNPERGMGALCTNGLSDNSFDTHRQRLTERPARPPGSAPAKP